MILFFLVLFFFPSIVVVAIKQQEEIIDPYFISLPHDIRWDILNRMEQLNVLIRQVNEAMITSKTFPIFIRKSIIDDSDYVIWKELTRLIENKGYNVDQPVIVYQNCPTSETTQQLFDITCFELKIKGVIFYTQIGYEDYSRLRTL